MKVLKSDKKPFRPGRGGVSFAGPGPGRPKGMPNKFTTLKQSFLNVYNRMGGEDELLLFAKSHKALFYQMLTKLFPQEVDHSGEISLDIKAKQIWELLEKAKREMGTS